MPVVHQGALDGSALEDLKASFVQINPATTNPNKADPVTTPQVLATPLSATGYQTAPVLIAASGAINPSLAANYVITKAGVAVMTIAAPVTGTDDGKIIEIASSTANQHTVTFTGNTLISGAAGVLTATFPASAGGNLRIMAMTAKWILLSNNLVVIT